MKILVVDDNEDMLLLLKSYLRQWGHKVVVAQNGAEAWHLLEEMKEIQFVISDWSMPLMNGVDFCRRLRENDYFDRYIYVILLTARTEKQDLIEGMEAGADDFMGKPFNKEELRVRIRAGERVLQLEKILDERNRRLKAAQAELQKDLLAASSLQKSLLPNRTEQPFTQWGFRFDWLYEPATFIGGDTLNIVRLDKSHAGLYIADVAGHGIPAAMTSVMLYTMLSAANGQAGLLKDDISYAPYCYIRPPAEALFELNNISQTEDDAMHYFTMIYGVLDVERSTLSLAQAGHPPPILLRGSGEVVLLESSGGVPIGMLPDMIYEESEVKLEPGDRIFFYTDGITECENLRGEQFSRTRLLEILTKNFSKSLETILSVVAHELREWRGSSAFDDDVSLLAIEKFAARS